MRINTPRSQKTKITEEYYLSLSKAERNEDRQWSKVAVRSAKRLWGKQL